MSIPATVEDDVRRALAEDVGDGDRTADLLPADAVWHATVVSREPAVLCGTPWVDAVYRQLGGGVEIRWCASDGDRVDADTVLCELRGPARILVTGERTALNFLQMLSGTATQARRYADAVAGSGTRILDTRKTIPGLRQAQKYATRCGGCTNHRMGLFDAILIKENHIIAAGSIAAAVATARQRHPGISVEVEVENLDELDQALASGADIVMVDNFSLGDLETAVARARGMAPLEVSGNVELPALRQLAETGVDFISTGALTKHVRAIDLSMRFDQ